MAEGLMVFTGNANPLLAAAVSKNLNLPLGKASVGRFSDGEVNIEIQDHVRGKDVFVLQSTCAPTNDNLMEIMVMADALKRSSAGRVTAAIPYFGYARQDRRPRSARVAISAKVVANMLQVAGIDRVLTMDLHADQIQGFFDIPVDNLYAGPMFARDIQARFQGRELMIVSPDVGGVVRARDIATRLGIDLAITDKRRARAGVSEVMNVIGDVRGKDCILVDDIVDSGGTLCTAAAALRANGARSASVYVTHGVLSGEAAARIAASSIESMTITDSILPTEAVCGADNIRHFSIAPILAEAMQRISDESSVSSLFD